MNEIGWKPTKITFNFDEINTDSNNIEYYIENRKKMHLSLFSNFP